MEVLDTLLSSYCFLGALAGAGIGPRSLSADRQSATVSNAPIAVDVFQPGDILAYLTAKLTFDRVVLVQQGGHAGQLILAEVARPAQRVNPRLVAKLPRDLRTDPIEVGQRDPSRFIVWYVDTEQTRHPKLPLSAASTPVSTGLTLPLLVAGVAANHENDASAADDLAVLTDSLNAGTYFHDDLHTNFKWWQRSSVYGDHPP
jgi:hypothetical protein